MSERGVFDVQLGRRYQLDPPAAPHDSVLLVIASLVCLVIGPAFAFGLEPWAVALAAAAVMMLATTWRGPGLLRGLAVPWVMAGAITLLTILVTWLHSAGHLDAVVRAACSGGGLADLLQLGAVTAVSANAINNLPAYLALEPAGAGDPVRLMAVLIGANVGPLVTPWDRWRPYCGCSVVRPRGCSGGSGGWRSQGWAARLPQDRAIVALVGDGPPRVMSLQS